MNSICDTFLSSAAFCAAYKICHLRPKASDCSPSEAIWLFTANLTTLPSLGCRWRVSWSCIRGGKRHSFAFSALVLSGLLDLARNLCWSYFEHLLDTSSRLSYPTNVNICLHAPEIQSTLAQFIATWEWFTLLSCHIKILEGTHKKGWNNKNVNLYTDDWTTKRGPADTDKERPTDRQTDSQRTDKCTTDIKLTPSVNPRLLLERASYDN